MIRPYPLLALRSLLAVGWLLLPSLLSAQSDARIAQAYLYIEPYQARFECLLDLPTALDWLALPGSRGEVLPTEIASEVLARARGLAASWCAARLDHLPVQPVLSVVQFVQGVPGRTLPLKTGAPVSPRGTMLGLMWELPLSANPDRLQIRWKGFIRHVESLPTSVFFGNASEKHLLTEAAPAFEWQNQDRLPAPKPLSPVPAPPPPKTLPVPVSGLAVLAIGSLLLLPRLRPSRSRRRQQQRKRWVVVWLLLSAAATPWWIIRIDWPASSHPYAALAPTEAEPIVSPLLRNIYRAFDHRQENAIYDVLSRSADGPLLKQLYLEIHGALSLDAAEGARVHVSEFASEVLEVQPGPPRQGFTARVSWSALGAVGHWGHSHTRTNVVEGRVTVQPVEGSWKITQLEVLDQRRL